jgi:hypothetical protein
MNNNAVRINHTSIPTFDGTASKFPLWWSKYKAFAMISGFADAIQEEVDPMLPSSHDQEIDSATESGRRMLLAKRKNEMAISSFTLSFTREGIMRLISPSKTKEWLDGLAYLVVKELNKKYQPIDIISKVEMRQRLNQVVMKKGSDLAELFETLSSIDDWYGGVGNLVAIYDSLNLKLWKTPESTCSKQQQRNHIWNKNLRPIAIVIGSRILFTL